jgi:Putative adhesin
MGVLAEPRRRSRLRIAFAVVGVVSTLVLIGIGSLLLLDLVARHTSATTTRYANVQTLIVRSGAGDVSLTSAPARGALIVETSKTESLFKPKLHSELAGDGTLLLTASCPNQLGCGVHYELSVPENVAIKVSSGFGGIHVTNLTSTSSIQLGTTAGDIDALGLDAPDVRLSTGLGGLTADLTEPARRLSASTVAGGLSLTVPDVTYALHASSGVGHLSDGTVQVDPNAPRTITARSSLGNITIAVR